MAFLFSFRQLFSRKSKPHVCDRCGSETARPKSKISNVSFRNLKVRLCALCQEDLIEYLKAKPMPADLPKQVEQQAIEKNLQLVLKHVTPSQKEKCQYCRTPLSKIIVSGKFGCPQCYKTFHQLVDQILQTHQGKVVHSGKKSARQKQRQDLQNQLETSRQNKDFQTAAEILEKLG